MKIVYGVYVDRSEDGRGPSHLIALFEREIDAEAVALENEPYGHKGQFTSVQIFEICAGKREYDGGVDEKLRKSALEKLNARERKALGL